jgi:hypothetical protein
MVAVAVVLLVLWVFEHGHAGNDRTDTWIPNLLAEWTGLIIAVTIVDKVVVRARDKPLRRLAAAHLQSSLRAVVRATLPTYFPDEEGEERPPLLSARSTLMKGSLPEPIETEVAATLFFTVNDVVFGNVVVDEEDQRRWPAELADKVSDFLGTYGGCLDRNEFSRFLTLREAARHQAASPSVRSFVLTLEALQLVEGVYSRMAGAPLEVLVGVAFRKTDDRWVPVVSNKPISQESSHRSDSLKEYRITIETGTEGWQAEDLYITIRGDHLLGAWEFEAVARVPVGDDRLPAYGAVELYLRHSTIGTPLSVMLEFSETLGVVFDRWNGETFPWCPRSIIVKEVESGLTRRAPIPEWGWTVTQTEPGRIVINGEFDQPPTDAPQRSRGNIFSLARRGASVRRTR